MNQSIQYKDGIRSGLITLAIILFLDVLGIPNTLGRIAIPLFVITVGLASFLSLRQKKNEDKRPIGDLLVNGLLIGLISGLGLAIVTYIFARLQANRVDIQDVFFQITFDHTGALTGLTRAQLQDGESVFGGLFLLLLFMTIGGIVGAVINQLFNEQVAARWQAWQDSEIAHWITLVLPFIFYGLFFILKIEGVDVAGSEETIVALVLLFIFIATALVAFRNARPGREQIILGILLLIAIIILPRFTNQFQNSVLGKIAIFTIVGLALNFVIGYAGMLHLGFVAFFAIGAYGFGLLAAPDSYFVLLIQETWPSFSINFWTALLLAIFLGIISGVLMGAPILRLRGDYLAIVTLGFGEIIRLLLVNLRDYTGGPGGVLDIPPPLIGSWDLGNPRDIFYLGMVFAAVTIFISYRLRDSRIGRAWMAMREDEDAAETMGINLSSIKLQAFAIGGALAAIAGVIYASQQVNIFPDNFKLETSIDIISLVIIGGLGSIEGIILGAVALVGLPEILRGVDEYRIVAFGALLIVMMIIRPQGLLPSARRQRELKGDDKDQDAWIKMAQQQQAEQKGEE